MNEKNQETTSVPAYAFSIGSSGDATVDKMYREASCCTCGYPFLQAGSICESCIKSMEGDSKAIGAAMQEHFSSRPRMTHVYGIGLIDPWSREGKAMLGEG